MRRTLWAMALGGLMPLAAAHAQSDEEAADDKPTMSAPTDEADSDDEAAPKPTMSAPDSADQEEAKRLYTSGAELYEEGNYELAIKAFREAYELSDRHPLLMNIANAYERLGDLKATVDTLDEYRIYADDETKDKLERRIRVLEERIDAQGDMAASSTVEAEDEPEMVPNPVKWVVLGSGGALAATFGAVTYVSYSNGQTAADAGDQVAYDSARSLNTIAGALTGVGGALMVVGIALPTERAVSITPTGTGFRLGMRF